MIKENWMPVKYQGVSYNGLYEVSNLGRARKIEGKTLKYVCKNTKRRRSMSLTKGAKSITVPLARVILSSFKGIVFGKNIIADHIDNDPCNNSLSNLQAITQSENVIKDGFWKKEEINKNFFQKRHTRFVLLKGNNLYKPMKVNLGRYEDRKTSDNAVCVAEEIVRLYKTKNNDKIATEIHRSIIRYRREKELTDRYGCSFPSSKIFLSRVYGLNIHQYVYNHYISI